MLRTFSLCVRSLSSTSRITLGNLSPNAGANKRAQRVGRGEGSGRGKTCGKGHKGQKSRAAAGRKIPIGFEGGQSPLKKRLPKRGFTSKKLRYSPLNLDTLNQFIEMGRLPSSGTITTKMLHESNIVGKVTHGIKLLSRGAETFDRKVKIQVSDASKVAQLAIEAKGGNLDFIYYNRLGLRATLHPHKFDILPKLARPPRKWALKHNVSDHL